MWHFTHCNTHTHTQLCRLEQQMLCCLLQGKAFAQMLLDLELSGLPDLTALMDTPPVRVCVCVCVKQE